MVHALVDVALPQRHVPVVHCLLVEEDAPVTNSLALTVTFSSTTVPMPTHSPIMMVNVPLPVGKSTGSDFCYLTGSNGGKPANNIVTTCKASTVTVTLCPGTTSHIPK